MEEVLILLWGCTRGAMLIGVGPCRSGVDWCRAV
jgi:hypothetical protein